MITEFASILELTDKFQTEQDCIDHLERIRWAGNVVSPFDSASKVYKCHGNKYKCKATGKYFNVRTGTIFEDTKMPLKKWFMALYIFSSHKKGISSHQLARDLDITQKTAWFVLHRLRYSFNHPVFKAKLGNVVESDSTYIGGKEINKHKSKKAKHTHDGAWINSKHTVAGVIERGGNVIAQHITDNQGDSYHSVVEQYVREGSTVYTDEAPAYRRLRGKFAHSSINHSAKVWVEGMVHTNTIEGYWSVLKRGINGIYHWVSFKHLQAYLNEFALRYNSRKINEAKRFNLVLTNMVGRLTYNELIGHAS